MIDYRFFKRYEYKNILIKIKDSNLEFLMHWRDIFLLLID
jgi:hypothetical protein